MAWDDFFAGANSTFDQGFESGTNTYLKNLAAKIQARQEDKKNLYDEVQAAKKRQTDMEDSKAKLELDTETAAKTKDTEFAMKREFETKDETDKNQRNADALKSHIMSYGEEFKDLAETIQPTAESIRYGEMALKDRLDAKKEVIKHQRELEKTQVGLENKRNAPPSISEARQIGVQAMNETGIPDLQSSIQRQDVAIAKIQPGDQNTNLAEMVAKRNADQAELDQMMKLHPGGVASKIDSVRNELGRFNFNQPTDTTVTQPPPTPTPTDQPVDKNAQADPQEVAKTQAEMAAMREEMKRLEAQLSAIAVQR